MPLSRSLFVYFHPGRSFLYFYHSLLHCFYLLRRDLTASHCRITLHATDNWIEFTVRYVVDYRKRRWMKDHLFTRILEEIDKSNDRIQLASATFEVVSGSTLDVHLSRGHAPLPL